MSRLNLILVFGFGALLCACSQQTQRSNADLGSGNVVQKPVPTSTQPAPPPPAPVADQHEAINWIEPGPQEMPAAAPAPAPAPDDTPRTYPTEVLPNRDDLVGQAVTYPDWPDNLVDEDVPFDVADLGPIPFETGTDLFALEQMADRGDGLTARQIFADPSDETPKDLRPDVSGPLVFGDDTARTQKIDNRPDIGGATLFGEDTATKQNIDNRPDISGPKVYGDDTTQSAKRDSRPDVSEAVVRKETIIVDLSADPLFNFDKFHIRADMRGRLDRLIAALDRTNYTIIDAVGHTDRIGTVAYNQKLSERRANAVKAYLVSKGIPEQRIRASGRGKMEPVSQNCNNKRRAELIACLESDRRVEVSVKARTTK